MPVIKNSFKLLTILIVLLLSSSLYGQAKLSLNPKSTMEAGETGLTFNNTASYKNLVPKKDKDYSFLKPLGLQESQVNIFGVLYALIFLPNPQLVYDDKELYFGLTKQLSFMLYRSDFGVGRLGFEYSYVFSKDEPNHFRASYVQDIPLRTSSFSMLLFSFEGGYFTDLDKKGISASAGINTLLGFNSFLFVNPYFKLPPIHLCYRAGPILPTSPLGVGIGFYFLD